MSWAERIYESMLGSLGDWVSSFELLRGRVSVSPAVSLTAALALTSIPSFSSDVVQLTCSALISSLWGLWLLRKEWIRFLKASLAWAGFSFLIMLPMIYTSGSLSPLLVPFRVMSSLLVLGACASLFGARSILRGMGFLVPQLPESMEIMMSQVSYYSRRVGRLILAKGSRHTERGLLSKYGVMSIATSELLSNGRDRAFLLSLVRKARIWDTPTDDGMMVDLRLLIAFMLSMAIPASF